MGFQATGRLLAVFGGSKLYVPAHMPPDHLIAKVVGEAAAARLVEAFEGETIDVPRNTEFDRLRRVAVVATLAKQGIDSRGIGERVGLTARHVRNLAGKAVALGLLKPRAAVADTVRQEHA